jgi:uncharacterized protein YgbK (DUF1537 family)
MSDAEPAHAQSARALVLLGDDLSGTTEALAASLGGHGPGWIHLHPSSFFAHFAQNEGGEGARRDALDLDVRRAAPSTARTRYSAAVEALLRQQQRRDVLLLKVDSLLRGNIAAALAAVPPAPQRPVVLAPALPAQGRHTLRGRVQLAEDATLLPGALEGARADVAAAAGRPTALLDLSVVRAGPQTLGTALGRLAEQGVVAVCDAETDDDLDAVAAAAIQHRHPVVVGAGGVAAALGRALRRDHTGSGGDPGGADDGCAGPLEPAASVLVVVGTAEPGSRPQVVRLQQAGAVVQSVDPSDSGPADEAVNTLDKALRTGFGVLQVAPGPVDVDRSSPVLDRLADTAAAVLARQPLTRVVLTGGATARAVLTRLRVATLRLQCQVHPGAAHLRTDDGRHVVTRPGSHGGVDSLARIAYHLGAPLSPRTASAAQTAAHQSTEGQA